MLLENGDTQPYSNRSDKIEKLRPSFSKKSWELQLPRKAAGEATKAWCKPNPPSRIGRVLFIYLSYIFYLLFLLISILIYLITLN